MSQTPNPTDRMSQLARSFPSLDKAKGLEPFNADAFEAWLRTSPAVTAGSRHAGRFVLSVFNPGRYQVTSADLRESLGIEEPRRASVWDDPAPIKFDALWPPSSSRFQTDLAFNVVEAFQAWDDRHRAAFIAWASAPWWL